MPVKRRENEGCSESRKAERRGKISSKRGGNGTITTNETERRGGVV